MQPSKVGLKQYSDFTGDFDSDLEVRSCVFEVAVDKVRLEQ